MIHVFMRVTLALGTHPRVPLSVYLPIHLRGIHSTVCLISRHLGNGDFLTKVLEFDGHSE